jgi:endonuclease YncB( thermonuclease family)
MADAGGHMLFTRSATSRRRAWQSEPSFELPGIRPVGAAPLIVALVGALVILALQPVSERSAVEVHGDIVGKARVIDGDTIDVSGYRIRLQGIDAPESNQACTDAGHRAYPCGRIATRELIEHLAGQPLKCASSGLDRYRRVLATCALPDGSDVNAWMVQQGWAVAYYTGTYRSEEAAAHAAKRGIWAGSFMVPSEWRHRHLL